MTIDSLLRGQAYHLTFIDKTVDAILIDVDYTSTHTAETITLFCIDDTQGVSSESKSVSASDFLEAEPLHMDNSSNIQELIYEVMNEFDDLIQRTDKRVVLFEDDAVDGIEQREDASCALFYLQMFTQYDYKKALIYALNSMPYLLKRKPQNKLAYKVLLYAIVKSASDANGIVKLPIFPNQSDLYAEDNVTMLRKMAYQLMYNFNSVSPDILTGAKRFRGYIKNYQSYNSRGLVLFADERNMLSFSDVNIMDLRLFELLKSGISEVGRIEIEFSLGYIPKEGGAQVATFVCTRICLSAASIECCRALGIELPEEFSRYEGYKETPICPTSYYPTDSYIGISRIFREESVTTGASGEKKGLLYPMGTQTGYILQWSCIPRKNGNGIDVWEGELGCSGNIIHFNLFQVYEKSLKQFLTNSPDQAIGIKVKFEPAFNAGKNRIAIWADVIRTTECNLEIPPEYNQEIPWSVERSQQEWTPPDGVADTYRVLQPWLPIFNPFLENCHVGKLDMNYLSSSQSFSEGRINLSSAQNAIWYSFPTSSIHERYLKNILMSALCYKVCSTAPTDNTAFEISVIFNLQPSSKPGRYMADNIILMPLSRGTIWNRCEKKYNCPVNRSGNILLEMADSYLPLQLKGKPLHVQRNYINSFGSPDIFRQDVEYSGQITKMFLNDAGIIVDSLTGAEIQFRSEQIYESGLLERAKNAFATNRYTGVLVKFQKKQALLDKSIVAIKADCIYSRDLEKKDVAIRTGYKALCDEESQLQKKTVSFRKGFLVDYRRTNEGQVAALEVAPITAFFDFDSLLYNKAENNYDKLIRGKISNINGSFKEAAALFMEGKPSQGHTIMQQKGEMSDGHLEGLRLVPSKEKRIAYADALVRNRDLVFDNYNKLLNAIADLLCTRREVIDWEQDFDPDAYRIMLQYKKAAEQFGIHEQMIQRVKNAIAQMEKAQDASNGGLRTAAVNPVNHQASSSQASTSPVSNGGPRATAVRSFNHQASSSQASTSPATSDAAIPACLPIMQTVPFLNYIIMKKKSSALTQKKILIDVMNNAEGLLRNANYLRNVSQNRLDAAAYYYGIVLRDKWVDSPDASYDFARRAMSFAVLPYRRFQDMISVVRSDTVLWQTLSLKEDIQLLPQTNNIRDRQMIHYLHLLMQTACLSKLRYEFFTQSESEMLFAIDNSGTETPWSQAFHSLCNSMNIPFTGDLRTILQSYQNNMNSFEQSLPRADNKAQSLSDYIRSFTRLGNRYLKGSPVHRCSQQAAKFHWVQDPRVATQGGAETILNVYLNSLEQLSSGASNEKTSIQINTFAEVLGSLKNIKNWIIQEPTILTAEYILPCVESYINCLETILRQLFISRHILKMEAQMGSINEAGRIFTVPVSIACDQESSSCRNVRISVERVTGAQLRAQRNDRVIHSIESGDTVVVEMQFNILENINEFRNKQTIPVALRVDYEAFKFSDGKLESYPEFVPEVVNCPIQQAQYDIDCGAFNSQSTQYDEKLFFAGRRDQIKTMEDALYDSEEKTFRYGVGIIIYGQRRSGKSWLAGRLCSELKKKEAVQAPIICDKIDITVIDLITEIINTIVRAMPENDRDLAQAALDYAKPYSMLDVVEKTLRLHKAKNEEVDFDELLSSLEAVKDGLRKISATEYASFPTFYYELERKYTERHGMPLPPITIVLDEFTGIYDKIMADSITLQETLSIIKLIESYRINVILICADHYKSVLAAIDENAFTHYKIQVEVTGLSEKEAKEMICRPLTAKRRGSTEDENQQTEETDENERPKSRIDEEAALHLHSLYNGNVFLLAMACEKVVEHMNTCGYLSMSNRQLDTFERDLLVSTMTMRSMEAYIVDGRFLEHKIASFVLTRLNIIAISTIAHIGTQGVALYNDVINAVKAEYQKLLMQEDMSHFVDLLNANGKEGKISDRDMVIEREYAMERISAENVLDWLVERKVLYKGSSANNEVTLELKLLAYIKASEIPNSECYQMEELSPHAQNSAENPVPNADLSVFDNDEDDSEE